jgi:hypothetical protein
MTVHHLTDSGDCWIVPEEAVANYQHGTGHSAFGFFMKSTGTEKDEGFEYHLPVLAMSRYFRARRSRLYPGNAELWETPRRRYQVAGLAAEEVDPETYYFRISPMFETCALK